MGITVTFVILSGIDREFRCKTVERCKTVARILAIDYGRKRLGIAVSDPLGITAQSQPAVTAGSSKDAIEKLKVVLNEFMPERIVLGLPLNLKGEIGPMAAEVKTFGTLLQESAGIPVDYLDERMTSLQAERALHEMGEKIGKKKDRVDTLSAVFILQTYLQLGETGRKGSQ